MQNSILYAWKILLPLLLWVVSSEALCKFITRNFFYENCEGFFSFLCRLVMYSNIVYNNFWQLVETTDINFAWVCCRRWKWSLEQESELKSALDGCTCCYYIVIGNSYKNDRIWTERGWCRCQLSFWSIWSYSANNSIF